jgi:hypothetical protein
MPSSEVTLWWNYTRTPMGSRTSVSHNMTSQHISISAMNYCLLCVMWWFEISLDLTQRCKHFKKHRRYFTQQYSMAKPSFKISVDFSLLWTQKLKIIGLLPRDTKTVSLLQTAAHLFLLSWMAAKCIILFYMSLDSVPLRNYELIILYCHISPLTVCQNRDVSNGKVKEGRHTT